MEKLLRLSTIGLLAVLCTVNFSFAQKPTNKMLELIPEIHKAVDADAQRVQDIFKDIHQHPELGFAVFVNRVLLFPATYLQGFP